VSLVDGYNLPMVVEAAAAGCPATGCVVDLNQRCPAELKAGHGQACRSACEAFGTPEYCCSGDHGNPDTCHPSVYSQMFKRACPRSYSYAYDDATSTFTCTGTDYSITFCPRPGNPNRLANSFFFFFYNFYLFALLCVCIVVLCLCPKKKLNLRYTL
jgi:hypothetical protein